MYCLREGKELKEKASPYLGMALLPFVFLGLELLVLFIESLFYGTMDFTEVIDHHGVFASLIHWGATCLVWVTGAWFLYFLSKRKGYNIFENNSKAPPMNWIIVSALLVLSIIASYLTLDMRFKPVAEFAEMINRFGNQATLAFIGQYIYYIVESALFLTIVVFGQKFGEIIIKKTNIPWGGILCGLTWGLGHILTQDVFTGIYAAAGSIAYGVVYLLLNRNVRLTYPVIALMFML